MPRSRVGIFSIERTRSTPMDPKLKILVCFVLFGCIWNSLVALRNFGAKRAKQVQKFVPQSRVGIFLKEHNRSTPLDSKLMFWCVSYYLDSRLFGCLLTLGAKRAVLVQKFVPRSRVGIFCIERSRSTPLDPKLKILVRFILFGCWDRLVALQNSVQNVPN